MFYCAIIFSGVLSILFLSIASCVQKPKGSCKECKRFDEEIDAAKKSKSGGVNYVNGNDYENLQINGHKVAPKKCNHTSTIDMDEAVIDLRENN